MIPTFLVANVAEKIGRLSPNAPEEKDVIKELNTMKSVLLESSDFSYLYDLALNLMRTHFLTVDSQIMSK